jgi:hypothetical protein
MAQACAKTPRPPTLVAFEHFSAAYLLQLTVCRKLSAGTQRRT